MYIISYKRFMFKGTTGNTFTTKGGGVLEEVPDWTRETELYHWASADGDIIETVSGSDKSAHAAVDKAEKAKRTRTTRTKVKEKEEAEPSAEAEEASEDVE